MDEAIDNFVSFTGATPEIARRYLGFTENNPEQAIQLFFDSPDLASGIDSQAPAPEVPSSTRPQPHASSTGRTDSHGIVHLDSDDENMDVDSEDEATKAVALGRAADVEDDEAMARRLQEEMYAGGDTGGGTQDADGVRAPIARRTETLIGGPDDGAWHPRMLDAAVAQQMRNRVQAGSSSRPGVFNQRPTATNRSIWEEPAGEGQRLQGLSQATGGASDSSQKAARLAELFRPPFEIMNQLDWDAAREKGKDELKWILVNIQDPSIFDCQSLNRDIWKDPGIKEVVKENFVFMQYSKDDPRGSQYIQYYFPLRDSDAAYPHIAIVDPRTGEQVKTWSGPPVPKAGDFLMQLVEFLDRYSLDLSKSNPVARRKPEKSKSIDVDRLTEEEMLDLALQNSLANNGAPGPKEDDPDELTKSVGDISKGKGKEVQSENSAVEEPESTNGHAAPSPFSEILSNNPHTEPPAGEGVTRIQFRHSTGRIVRRFRADDTVRRIYEWLKADPLEGKDGISFELKGMGKDLLEYLNETIEDAGLKNGTVMVEFLED